MPEGWQLWYGLACVGQPVKFFELYSHHSADVVVGMTGRLSATYCSIGARSVVWVARDRLVAVLSF